MVVFTCNHIEMVVIYVEGLYNCQNTTLLIKSRTRLVRI